MAGWTCPTLALQLGWWWWWWEDQGMLRTAHPWQWGQDPRGPAYSPEPCLKAELIPAPTLEQDDPWKGLLSSSHSLCTAQQTPLPSPVEDLLLKFPLGVILPSALASADPSVGLQTDRHPDRRRAGPLGDCPGSRKEVEPSLSASLPPSLPVCPSICLSTCLLYTSPSPRD